MRQHSRTTKLAFVGFATSVLALGYLWGRADLHDPNDLDLIGKAEAAGGTVVLNGRVMRGQATPSGVRLQVESGNETNLQARMVINGSRL